MFILYFKQKTAYELRISDWSSDVCSSDLPLINGLIVDGVNTGQKRPIAPMDFKQCYAKDTAKSDKPTWTIDLEYKPANDILLFAKWTRGYRAGGVNPTYVPYNAWGPEKVDTYELGTKT